MSEPKIELSIVVPAYNEAKRISQTLQEITRFCQGMNYELLVVDDGSTDSTAAVVEALKLPHTTVLSYGRNMGKGYAVQYGMLRAVGDWILFTDADNSTPISEYPALQAEQDKYQVIIGSRYLAKSNVVVKQSRARIILSRIGNILAQIILLPGIKDTQCGFKLFSSSAAKAIFSKQTIWRWGFDMEILRIARELGYKIKEVPVTWYNDEQTHLQSRRVFTKTFAELLRIKLNSLQGKYRA